MKKILITLLAVLAISLSNTAQAERITKAEATIALGIPGLGLHQYPNRYLYNRDGNIESTITDWIGVPRAFVYHIIVNRGTFNLVNANTSPKTAVRIANQSSNSRHQVPASNWGPTQSIITAAGYTIKYKTFDGQANGGLGIDIKCVGFSTNLI